MYFKVKDLMISTLGNEPFNPAFLQGPNLCGGCTLSLCTMTPTCGCNSGYTRPPPDCGCPTHFNGGHSMKLLEADAPGHLPMHLESIEQAKTQMKERLAQLEAYQKSVEESLKPATVADVEALEVKLNEALQELARRKKELQLKK